MEEGERKPREVGFRWSLLIDEKPNLLCAPPSPIDGQPVAVTRAVSKTPRWLPG